MFDYTDTLSAIYLLTSLDKFPPGTPCSTVDRAWAAISADRGEALAALDDAHSLS